MKCDLSKLFLLNSDEEELSYAKIIILSSDEEELN